MLMTTNRQKEFIPASLRVFNELMNTQPAMVNISESKEDFQLEMYIPGVSKEQVSLTLDEKNNLIIEVHNNESEGNKEERVYLQRQFSQKGIKQTFILSRKINKEKISARVENGILLITLPKISDEEKKKALRTIDVN